MQEINVMEAEYLRTHLNFGYETEILTLKEFPDYLDCLPRGCIVRKVGVRGIPPELDAPLPETICRFGEEYGAFVRDAVRKITGKLREKGWGFPKVKNFYKKIPQNLLRTIGLCYNKRKYLKRGNRDVKLIDGHMHTKYFPENWFIDCANARGYSAYAILSLSCMKSFNGAANNEQCLAVKRADPRRAYFFAGLVHPCQDYKAHVQYWLDRGADGIKLIETKPTVYNETGVDLSDEKFDAMFDYLEKNEIPVLWHVGDPATFWKREEAPAFAFENGWFYGDGGFPSLKELYAITEKVLAKHPRLHACLAHLYFCGDDRKHAEHILDTYPNVRLDITPGGEMYEHFEEDLAGWREFFIKYQDRIQLGTDTDMGDELGAHTSLQLATSALTAGPVDHYGEMWENGLGLPEEVVEKIVYGNFRAFAGDVPKAL